MSSFYLVFRAAQQRSSADLWPTDVPLAVGRNSVRRKSRVRWTSRKRSFSMMPANSLPIRWFGSNERNILGRTTTQGKKMTSPTDSHEVQ